MTILQNMMQKAQEIHAQFDLLSQKISRLRTAIAIENDPASKFKLEKQIEEAKAECEQVEQQLTQLQHDMETYQTQVTPKVTATETPRIDWGEAPDVSVFFGRTKELETLEQWILKDCCRLVAVLGIAGIGKTRLSVKLGKGGIGKTDLTAKLAEGIQEKFDFVIWKKLLNAPPITEILPDMIKFLSNQQEINLPDNIDTQISRLLHYFKERRCLLILDNMEAVLQGGDRVGHYREGYEGYGELLRQVGDVAHQSCVLLTSREEPQEIAQLEGQTKPVRSLELGGLDEVNGRKLFEAIGEFSGSDKDWKTLIEFYNGNPLALELAAKNIQEVFFGDIAGFLKEGKPVFGNLRDLLDWHFERVTELEKEVMYWLAINRESVLFSELREDLLSPYSKDQLSSTLQSLQRRIPLEKSAIRFSLQPALIEYMTDQMINHICKEMKMKELTLFNSYALLKALAKDYIRESQIRLVLRPILARLFMMFGGQTEVVSRSCQILSKLRTDSPHKQGYAAGNVLNLLCQMNADVTGCDFSSLTIRQGYFQGANLHKVNFAYATFAQSVFTQKFGCVLSVAFSPDGNCWSQVMRITRFTCGE